MKKLILIFTIICFYGIPAKADSDPNLLDKTQTATVDVNAMFYVVLDPNNTPVDRKVTWVTLNNTWTGSANITILGTIATGAWNADAVDISDYTNLTAGTHVSLTDDTFDVLIGDVENGDDVNVPTCDNVYDYIDAQSFLTTVDISDNTNLAVGTHLSLTDDTLDVLIALVTNGDDVNIPTCDNVYDFVTEGWTASTGAYDLGSATSLEIPNGTDPDVDAAGEISWDSNDYALRGFDDTNQVVIGQKLKILNIAISNPDQLADTDTFIVWENHTGFTYVIERIYARCDDQAGDDGDFTLKEITDLTDNTALTTIEAITMSTDGTGLDYAIIGANDIDHATIEDNHGIIFDASADDLDQIKICIVGYLSANKN